MASDVQLPGVITGMGSTEVVHPTLGLVPVVILDIKVTCPGQASVRVQHRMEYPELAQPLSAPPAPPTQSVKATKRRKHLVHHFSGNRKNHVARQQWMYAGQ
jgi:hypothetical protein